MRYLLAGLAFGLAAAPLSATNLVTNGDFSDGAAGFTTTYSPVISPSTENQGSYTILANPATLLQCSGCFPSFGDHTTGTGNMLLVNTANATNPETFWSQTFAVTADTDYAFSFWTTSLGLYELSPTLKATINGQDLLSTGILPYFNPNEPWLNFSQNWHSGSATSVTLSFFSNRLGNPYNDFALDDISFTRVDTQTSAVPEPATWGMMVLGFGLVGGAIRRRSTRAGFA